MDALYCPALDLTRIGYPDWCQSPLNRWLYGDCCCRDTRQQPAYIHNPMYVPQAGTRQMEPIPEGPFIPPREDVGPDSQSDEPVPTRIQGIPDAPQMEKGDRLLPAPPVPVGTPPVTPPLPATSVP